MISPRRGDHDAPAPAPARIGLHDLADLPPLRTTAHADRIDGVEQVARPDLWCPRCHRWTRVEFDILSLGVVIATVQGCVACKSGIYDSLL